MEKSEEGILDRGKDELYPARCPTKGCREVFFDIHARQWRNILRGFLCPDCGKRAMPSFCSTPAEIPAILEFHFWCPRCRKNFPLADLETFLIQDLRLDPAIVQTIRRRHLSVFDSNKRIDSDAERSKIATLRTPEAKKRIEHLGVLFRSFKEYCREHDLCLKKGREVFFVDSFIEELEDEWIRKEEVIKAFGFSLRRFYQLLKEKKCATLKIGRRIIVKARRVVESTKNRCGYVQ